MKFTKQELDRYFASDRNGLKTIYRINAEISDIQTLQDVEDIYMEIYWAGAEGRVITPQEGWRLVKQFRQEDSSTNDKLDEQNRRELFKDDPTVNIAALRARKLRSDLESMIDSGEPLAVESAPFRGKHLIPERKKDIEKMREAIKVLAASQDVRITYLPTAEKEYKTARAALVYRFSAFFVEDTMEALKTLISLSESVNFRVENTPDNGRDIVISFDTGKIWEEA